VAVATAFRVVPGVVQFLGLVRWPFLVPYLAHTYLDPASNGPTRESVAVVFEAFNQYAGVGVGENLGYLFTSLGTFLVALLAMFGSSLSFRRWLGLLGVVSAVGIVVGIVVGMLEPAGFEPAANIVVVGYNPVVDLARLDRHIPMASQVARGPGTSRQPGRQSGYPDRNLGGTRS
jgi:hypothetical protein